MKLLNKLIVIFIIKKKKKKVISEPRTSLLAQTVKCLPTVQETRLQALGQEDLEKGMATHSSTLA